MRDNFNFLKFSETITDIILLPNEAKEKKYPFIVVNTDNNRGLYVKKLESMMSKYRLIPFDGVKIRDIRTSDLIIFGGNVQYDYKIEMNYVKLHALAGKKFKVFDIVDDFDKIVRRLETYCKYNKVRCKCFESYYDRPCCSDIIEVRLVEEKPKKKVICPFRKTKKTLVDIYDKPDISVDKVTVFDNWVKIGWNQYDIYVDLLRKEFITLEDGEKLYVKTDRFGRRYLAQ